MEYPGSIDIISIGVSSGHKLKRHEGPYEWQEIKLQRRSNINKRLAVDSVLAIEVTIIQHEEKATPGIYTCDLLAYETEMFTCLDIFVRTRDLVL